MLKNLSLVFILTASFVVSNVQASPQKPDNDKETPPNPIKGTTCWAELGLKLGLDSKTQIVCGIIGQVTFSQIYEKGFRVVSLTHNPEHTSSITLIIEEQR